MNVHFTPQRNRTTWACLALVATLLAACGGSPATPSASPTSAPPTSVPPTSVPPTSAPPTAEPTAAAPLLTVFGSIAFQAPPTPKTILYLQSTTGAYYRFDVEGNADGPAPFSVQVPAGEYVAYARTVDGQMVAGRVSYASPFERELPKFQVYEPKTYVDLQYVAPGIPCTLIPIPASPDGQFPEIARDCQVVYYPLADTECASIQEQVGTLLQSEARLYSAVFNEPGGLVSGDACSAVVTGTGAQFSDPASVVDTLRAGFFEWSENHYLDADGPTGMARGFQRGKDALLISANWAPAPEANCPPDQPVDACPLTPEQHVYTISVTGATLNPPPPASEGTVQVSGFVRFVIPAVTMIDLYFQDAQGAYYRFPLRPAEWGEGGAPFTLNVPPGEYLVYAYSTYSHPAYTTPITTTYNPQNAYDLPVLTIKPGADVHGVLIDGGLPNAPCHMVSVPAAPDGKYPAMPRNCTLEYQPLSDAECQALGAVLTGAYNVPVEMGTARFTNVAGTGMGTACEISARVPVERFKIENGIFAPIAALLPDWTEDFMGAAGGAGGEAHVLRRDLAELRVSLDYRDGLVAGKLVGIVLTAAMPK